MNSDELATKELAQWREQETKHVRQVCFFVILRIHSGGKLNKTNFIPTGLFLPDD
jgi:hypothetical protein